MAEPALRLLDKGLPRLDMRRTDSADRWLMSLDERTKPSRAAKSGEIIQQLRALLRDARKDREEAAAILAEARAQARTIIAEANECAEIATQCDPARPSVLDIQKQTAQRYGVALQALLGPGRARLLVSARHEAITLAHAAWPELSYPALGRLFQRDHTAILHVVRKARGQA